MRFMRGIAVGFLFFIATMFAMFVVMGNTGGFGSDEEFSLDVAMQEVPEWTTILLICMFGMCAGPIYYWIIEPVLEKRKKESTSSPLATKEENY